MTTQSTTVDFIQCTHCKNKVQMIILSETTYRENYPDSEYSDYSWEIFACPYCSKPSVIQSVRHSPSQDIWYDDENGWMMDWPGSKETIYPRISTAPEPAEGMPNNVQETYREAMSVVDI